MKDEIVPSGMPHLPPSWQYFDHPFSPSILNFDSTLMFIFSSKKPSESSFHPVFDLPHKNIPARQPAAKLIVCMIFVQSFYIQLEMHFPSLCLWFCLIGFRSTHFWMKLFRDCLIEASQFPEHNFSISGFHVLKPRPCGPRSCSLSCAAQWCESPPWPLSKQHESQRESKYRHGEAPPSGWVLNGSTFSIRRHQLPFELCDSALTPACSSHSSILIL